MANKICKKCGEEINLTIFGLPEDICWGCANKEQKNITTEKNLKMKQATAVKNSGPTSFWYADCPECGKTNILQNERPGTLVDKVFCVCGCVFQLVTVEESIEKSIQRLKNSCPLCEAGFPVTTRVWLEKI